MRAWFPRQKYNNVDKIRLGQLNITNSTFSHIFKFIVTQIHSYGGNDRQFIVHCSLLGENNLTLSIWFWLVAFSPGQNIHKKCWVCEWVDMWWSDDDDDDDQQTNNMTRTQKMRVLKISLNINIEWKIFSTFIKSTGVD